MFKKSLAAVAVLGAFAASSMAADVQLYGVVDYGMIYTNSVEKTEGQSNKNVDKFELNSGVNSGSRFGIKATEDLGNGYKVSFKLENGFEADDGTMGQDNRLFGREASLSVSSSWGTLSAGRMGAISAAAGTYDFMALADAFDGGDGDINGFVGTSRMDNMLVYQSPKVAGLQLTAEYSFKNDNKADDKREGHSDANRYAGFALTGEYGDFQALAAYEQILKSDTIGLGAEKADAKIVTVGGNYNCGFATTFVSGQYFENLDDTTDGYALHVGAQIPVAAGTLTTGLYYNDKDNGATKGDSDYIGGSVKYEYPLSARTLVYGSVGYSEEDAGKTTTEFTQAYFGLTHTF